jgi:enamine deaminase RidA (YjgF/YER057c/UK114 family)
MAGKISARLAELGIELPAAQPPLAAYVPYVVTGNLVVISGQLPMQAGTLAVAGKLGETVTLEQGQQAARLCLLNVLAHLSTASASDLDRVKRLVRLGGFVACTPAFTQHPAVINGASELAVQIFGEAGRHARAAVGVSSLPLDAAVELEALVELA